MIVHLYTLLAASSMAYGMEVVVGGTSRFVNGIPCRCVPVHECSGEMIDGAYYGAHMFDPKLNGYGTLDVRTVEDKFPDEGCLTSNERCCIIPEKPKTPEPTTQTPEPSTRRAPTCGLRNPDGLDALFDAVEGVEAKFGEFPWMVSLHDVTGKTRGAGALIHPQVVITVAHKLKMTTAADLQVKAGEWDTLTTQESLPDQVKSVKEIYIHQDYDGMRVKTRQATFNIALLLLNQSLELGPHISPVCMPDQGEEFEMARGCVVTGWGKFAPNFSRSYDTILKKLELDMVPKQNCSLLLRPHLGSLFSLQPSYICAGGQGKDACEGNGGAPLVCPSPGGYKLTGLVAWGLGCGSENTPGVYTEVSAFRTWVDDRMRAWKLSTDGYTA